MEGKNPSTDLINRDKNKYEVYKNFSQIWHDTLAKQFIIVEDTTGGSSVSETTNNQILAEETLLSDHDMRELLLNDITEIQSFVTRRIQELEGAEQAIFMTYDQSNKAQILQENDNNEFLESVLPVLREAYEILTSKRLYMLLDIKHNPNSKDRIKSNLEKNITWADKYKREQKWQDRKSVV